MVNKNNRNFNENCKVCAITVPGNGDFTKIMLQDLAILTGATLFDESENEKILNCTIDDLGE